MSEEQDVDMQAVFDLSKMKKKKTTKKKKAEGAGDEAGEKAESTSSATATSAETNTPPTYSYSPMLQRVVDLLHHNNPELEEKRRATIKPPQLMKGWSHACIN